MKDSMRHYTGNPVFKSTYKICIPNKHRTFFFPNEKVQGRGYTCRLYASASTFVQLVHTAFSSGYGVGGDGLELHIEASSSTWKGRREKASKQRVWKRDSKALRGVTGRPLRDGQCRCQGGLSLPSLGFTLFAQSCTPHHC